MLATLAAVAVGGALGALGRYALSTWVQGLLGGGFPWGTLAVNAVGSLLLGVVFGALERGTLAPELQALLAVGLLGSFTTFSTFSLESIQMLQDGDAPRAAAYVVTSVLLGLGFAAVGVRLATR